MITYLDQDPKFYYGHYPEHGTTGYDEAAGQGLMAGINAHN